MIPYVKEAGAVLVLALLTWGGTKLYQFGYENGHNAASVSAEKTIAEFAKAEAEAQAKARAAEQARVAGVAQAAAEAERANAEGQERANRTIADLRNGNLRLRKLWEAERATDRLSDNAAATLAAEQIAQLRAEAIGRVRGIGAEADAQVRGLQDAYEAVR